MSVINILEISSALLILSFFQFLFLHKKKKVVIKRINKLIMALGALVLTLLSLLVVVKKVGGTIMSTSHGWPRFYLTHNIKDVVDGALILEWNFISGSLFIYPISNYIFYLSAVLFFYFLIKLFIKSEKKTAVVLLLIIAALSTALIASQKIKELYIKQEIKQANYCEADSDCENAVRGGQCPFGCYAYVNRNEVNKVSSLINSFRSTCVYSCVSCLGVKCEDKKCQPICADLPSEQGDNMEISKIFNKIKYFDEDFKISYFKDTPFTEEFEQIINSIAAPLSISEELEIKFKSAVKNADVRLDNSSLWWNDEDGYSILVPGIESVIASRDNGAEEDFMKNNFSRDLLKIAKQVLIERGFTLNEQNSSLDENDRRFYDYVQAYEKGKDLCVIKVNPDYSSYGCGEDAFMCRTVKVTCGNDLAGSQAEQRPFLEALKLKNKETIATIFTQDYPFYQVSMHGRRAGSTAVLKKEINNYRVLFIGQEDPSCDLMDEEKIPASVLSSIGRGGCWTDTGYRRVDN